ncbi:hypothetical protein B0J12DRAFT_198185 [Macrophomina phaseolina]|uniref:Secreted protein n=1 Tax=Macrophomina phaseolina TaxID=35725 RepID=A0ABQ8G322_9PEZI|nr:hypothetical protein B0J12DRAFT_198185 [Macrophomina phaseolina]
MVHAQSRVFSFFFFFFFLLLLLLKPRCQPSRASWVTTHQPTSFCATVCVAGSGGAKCVVGCLAGWWRVRHVREGRRNGGGGVRSTSGVHALCATQDSVGACYLRRRDWCLTRRGGTWWARAGWAKCGLR